MCGCTLAQCSQHFGKIKNKKSANLFTILLPDARRAPIEVHWTCRRSQQPRKFPAEARREGHSREIMVRWLTWVEVVRNPIGYFIAHMGHIG